MVEKAARQDQAFLIDLASLQEKHIETAKLLLGDGPALNKFAARLLDDIANLKAMLHAISIGESALFLRLFVLHIVLHCPSGPNQTFLQQTS